VTRSPVNNW